MGSSGICNFDCVLTFKCTKIECLITWSTISILYSKISSNYQTFYYSLSDFTFSFTPQHTFINHKKDQFSDVLNLGLSECM